MNVETEGVPWWVQEGTIDLEERRKAGAPRAEKTASIDKASNQQGTLFKHDTVQVQPPSPIDTLPTQEDLEKKLPEATHKIGAIKPVQVLGDRRLFTDTEVLLVKISGGRGKGPVYYRALTSFDAHFDDVRRHYDAGVKLRAPRVIKLNRPA